MQASDVKRFAVIGLGKMGVDWVANLVEGGYEVVGYDTLGQGRARRRPRRWARRWAGSARSATPRRPTSPRRRRPDSTVVDSEEELIEAFAGCQVLLEVILEDLG